MFTMLFSRCLWFNQILVLRASNSTFIYRYHKCTVPTGLILYLRGNATKTDIYIFYTCIYFLRYCYCKYMWHIINKIKKTHDCIWTWWKKWVKFSKWRLPKTLRKNTQRICLVTSIKAMSWFNLDITHFWTKTGWNLCEICK